MLASAFLLLLNSGFLTLRLSDSAGSFPRALSAKEEAEALARFAAGDMEARNKLIEHNLRLVAHIVKKYYAAGCDQDDLISIGTIGLIKGISSYKTDKGVKLATYVSRCIENEILMYFRSEKKNAGLVSLSDSPDGDSDGESLSLEDTLCDDFDMVEELGNRELCASLRSLMDQVLDEREKEILILRYGLRSGHPLPQRDVAEQTGISRSYVSRIEKKALEKLRIVMEDC